MELSIAIVDDDANDTEQLKIGRYGKIHGKKFIVESDVRCVIIGKKSIYALCVRLGR